MSNDDSLDLQEYIEDLESEYGIEFPEELEMRMLESGFQELALERDDSVPSRLRRTFTLSSLNRIYGGMRDSIQQINEMMDNVPDEDLDDEELEQVERGMLRTFMADDILIFFVLAQDTIENLTVDVLNEDLIAEEYQGTNETMKTLRKRLPQPGCEHLLLRCGIVDHETVDEMRTFRKRRNRLVHDRDVHHTLDFEDPVMHEVDRGLAIINALYEHLEGEPFWSTAE
ncbi:hypothetical protein [Halorussus marinus]|uniref:hypothetical protein n=1 Tax=Halorussus marinus TaxID=2505976 RepID=UPI00106E30F5|nr:hypothetical protein [Halorussus marinus]